jgi:hypothetical protein
MKLVAADKTFPINPIIKNFSVCSSEARFCNSLICRPSAHRRQFSVGIFRILRNDIDDAIYCVGSPYSSTRTSNDFDSVYVFKQRVLNLPIDTGKERGINAAPIKSAPEATWRIDPKILVSRRTNDRNRYGPLRRPVRAVVFLECL